MLVLDLGDALACYSQLIRRIEKTGDNGDEADSCAWCCDAGRI
jgi:hypothetical protein